MSGTNEGPFSISIAALHCASSNAATYAIAPAFRKRSLEFSSFYEDNVMEPSTSTKKSGTSFEVGDTSVIIISDNESIDSNQSDDLFGNDEDSCDATESRAMVSHGGNIISVNEQQSSLNHVPDADQSNIPFLSLSKKQGTDQHNETLPHKTAQSCNPSSSTSPHLSDRSLKQAVAQQNEALPFETAEGFNSSSSTSTHLSDRGMNQSAEHQNEALPHESAQSCNSSSSTSSPLSKDNSSKRALEKSLMRLEEDTGSRGRTFQNYMQLKKDKLRYQVNVLGRPHLTASKIFEGISIFVNGHTEPTALELRQLIQLHGGEYHCYYEYGTTSFVIASSLATTKVSKTRQNEKFVRPDWIVDSIAAGKLLDVRDYLLLSGPTKGTLTSAFHKKPGNDETRTNLGMNKDQRLLDARDPNFLETYYARSRLHLISTLAQEMKDYVCALRAEDGHSFPGRESLAHLMTDDYEHSFSKTIFHVDLDCFFVSVALRDRPDLVDKPVAITHSKGVGAGFSELACVSYAARHCGLRNGMIVRDAIKRCPQLVCLPYAFDEYRVVAKAIYTIVSRYTLEIKAVSCDEMYIDFTNLLKELRINNAASVAEHLRAEIKRETGCPASVGIGSNTLIARLATRYAKPDGVRYVPSSESDFFIANEKVKNLPGLGYQTYCKLVNVFGNVEKCSDLQMVPQSDLERLLGKKAGDQLYKMCRGENEDREFITTNIRKSVSCDINYGIRFTKKAEISQFLNVVAQELEKKLLNARMATRSVTLKLMIRSPDAPVETPKYLGHGECDAQSKSASLDQATCSAQVIADVALKLFTRLGPLIADVRGIGVQCGRLVVLSDAERKSAKSESINKIFCPHGNKNEQKMHKAGHKQEIAEERELPAVFISESPTFFGERDMMRVKNEMLRYLRNEPNEDAVDVVTDFLFQLLRDGCHSTLISTCLFMHRQLYATTTVANDPGWLFAMNFIFDSLDEKCCKLYGAPSIRPAILRCKEY
ncbi:hypothetical protein RB195_012880 [Necator americanus]|uniref:DNA repair protein REV1 n=1 Tax=Necator americanus TaxID=51031 RepID=A0ABR1DSZ7_NECAM